MSYSRVPNIDRMTSLKVDNLTDRVTPEDLQRAFEQFSIDDVSIPRHPCTGEHQGFAFVRFYDSRDAEEAMNALDRHLLDGRELRVQMAVPAISSGDPDRSLALSRSPRSGSPSGRLRSSAPSSSNSSHSTDSRFISVLDKDAKETPESTQTGQNATDNEVIDNSKVMKHSKVIIHRPRNEEEMIAWVLKGAVKQPEEPENIRLYYEDMRKFKQSRKLRYE